MALFWRLALTAIAVGAVLWAASFVRAAIRTLRFGAPFTLQGHREGTVPVEARFGRIGAVLITATTVAVAFMAVRIAIVVWLD